jgi:uncharacterized membrane protein YccF (DUF307 family)
MVKTAPPDPHADPAPTPHLLRTPPMVGPRGPGAMLEVVKTVLNVLWLVLCGFWLAVGYAVAGVIMCILIITIPFGIASFRLAAFTLWPFGRVLVPKADAGAGSFIGNVLWFLLAGLWMAIAHIVTGVLLCLTIIGIPLGLADFKLAAAAVAPLGKDIVASDDPRAIVRS